MRVQINMRRFDHYLRRQSNKSSQLNLNAHCAHPKIRHIYVIYTHTHTRKHKHTTCVSHPERTLIALFIKCWTARTLMHVGRNSRAMGLNLITQHSIIAYLEKAQIIYFTYSTSEPFSSISSNYSITLDIVSQKR